LIIVCSNVTTDVAGKQITIRFNGDSGSNYNWVRMSGDGSSASSAAVSSFSSIWLTEGAATSDTERQQTIIQVLDFAQTDKHKSLISRAGQSAAGTNALAGRWASTSAITSFALPLTSGNYNAGSTFSLYGLEG
jgi:hypothetical protein